jgi:hypothetical protein
MHTRRRSPRRLPMLGRGQQRAAGQLAAVRVGAAAVGAAAVGAGAVGALAVGRLAVGRAVVRQLKIQDLEVTRLRVHQLQVDQQATAAPPATLGNPDPSLAATRRVPVPCPRCRGCGQTGWTRPACPPAGPSSNRTRALGFFCLVQQLAAPPPVGLVATVSSRPRP